MRFSPVLMVFAAFSVCAAESIDREVRIFFNSDGHQYTTGSVIPRERLNTILFLKEPCPLDISRKGEMLRAWMAYGAYQLGCWAPTIDDEYLFVGQLPELSFISGAPWQMLPKAALHADGTATITEPDYDSTTFTERVMRTLATERLKNLQQAP